LHDTPSKFIWQEDRAFSHGCIRVAKPKELAAMIMKNDKKWNAKDRNRDEQRRRILVHAQKKIRYTLVISPLG
jgi:murein L,D-transpeptidase YcbB/YkuD